MTKEQKFYKALQDIFIGVKIEGTGGFINLMKIKSKYYQKIEQILKEDVNKVLEKQPSFREELFDKLYSFFNRYFTESGSIYFNSTAFHNNVYEKVYTDDKDVILFWKTQMLYYVKTDRIFKSLTVEFDGLKFYFDASTIENKKANEKRDLIYELQNVKEDNTIELNVIYSEKGRTTKIEDILKELKKKDIKINEERLKRAFRIFKRQSSEVDFFINKNAKAFLQEQFKLWSYQYFWDGAKEWSTDRVNELQILKDIAFKIIDFISQFEDELVKIWNKPKFVKNSNYVITIDRLAKQGNGIKIIEKIINHPNFNEQVKEWEELGIIDDSFDKDNILENTVFEKQLSKKYQFLPIDTKYFKDIELKILSLFDDLDKSLDGWLIKSENYQALNTILPKFKEKVQTIYIDPPFNLDSSDQFLYCTNYKDANWATLLENRLRIAREWLNEKGSIFVRCDYNGNWIVRCLMDEIFGKENFRNEIIILATKKGSQNPEWEPIKRLYVNNNYLLFFSKQPDTKFGPFPYKNRNLKGYWHSFIKKLKSPKELPEYQYELFGIKPTTQYRWLWKKDKALKAIDSYKLFLESGVEDIDQFYFENQDLFKNITFLRKTGSSIHSVEYYIPYREFIPAQTLWDDIHGYTFTTEFSTENSEILLKRVIESTSNETDLILDFFLGSGTTTAVAHKLGRKWLGVEMGEHFYTVVLPRMKKVLAYDKSGISKEVKEYQGGGFFKYYELEQYEETLANCKYEDGDLFDAPGRNPYQEYVFLKDEKMLKALEIDYENNKVKVDLSKLYPNIDIAETLYNLTGKWIKRITPLAPLQEGYETPLAPLREGNFEVEFEDGTKINTKDLDYKLIKPLIWWE